MNFNCEREHMRENIHLSEICTDSENVLDSENDPATITNKNMPQETSL
jgi:hypothetical protein